MHRVFVGCIPGDTDSIELAKILRRHADVKKVSLVVDYNHQNLSFCKGYGFAVCKSIEDMLMLDSMDGKISYRGRQLTLRKYQTGAQLTKARESFNNRRLFIGNVPNDLDENQLKSILSSFGPIEKLFLVNQESRRSLRFGYIIFLNPEDASRILSHIKKEGKSIIIQGKPIRIETYTGKHALEEEIESLDNPKVQADTKKVKRVNSNNSFKQSILTGPKSSKIDPIEEYFEGGQKENKTSNRSKGNNDVMKETMHGNRPMFSGKIPYVKIEEKAFSIQFTTKKSEDLLQLNQRIAMNHYYENIRTNICILPLTSYLSPGHRIAPIKAEIAIQNHPEVSLLEKGSKKDWKMSN